jgi:hypothetical protein
MPGGHCILLLTDVREMFYGLPAAQRYLYTNMFCRHTDRAQICPTEMLQCLLTYADACWRMLTYANVCWRMLTYADVCRLRAVSMRAGICQYARRPYEYAQRPAALLCLTWTAYSYIWFRILLHICPSLSVALMLAPACLRQHTSVIVGCVDASPRLLTSAYVSIRQHTSAYVSIRQHTTAYVSIRQHTSAYVSIRQGWC